MTENEAKTKFCPMISYRDTNLDRRCRGSDCMLWRWDRDWVVPDGKPVNEGGLVDSKTHGGCGLAPP